MTFFFFWMKMRYPASCSSSAFDNFVFSPKKARNNVDQTDFMLLPKDHRLLTRTTWKPSHTHNQNQASTIFWKCQCLADKRIFRLDKNLIGNNLLDLHSQNRNTTTIYWLVSTSFNKRWWLLTRYWHTYKRLNVD